MWERLLLDVVIILAIIYAYCRGKVAMYEQEGISFYRLCGENNIDNVNALVKLYAA